MNLTPSSLLKRIYGETVRSAAKLRSRAKRLLNPPIPIDVNFLWRHYIQSREFHRDILRGDLSEAIASACVEPAQPDSLPESACPEVRDFFSQHGRLPKILHVGNIANNAYYNSNLLRHRGFVSDVLCNDYYHTMACPEWDDADFSASFPDQNLPDWDNVDLGGFRRPRWFVQAPLHTSLAYLWALRTGRTPAAEVFWNLAERQRRAVVTGGDMMYEFIGLLIESVMLDKGEAQDADFNFDLHVHHLIDEFARRFPDRQDKLSPEDLEAWRWCAPYFRLTLQQYDIVIGYGASPIPLMASGIPYFALEHGTLREVPFQPTEQGRCTALAYALAQWVFITNSDCTDKAAKLGINGFTFINHPYDENSGLNRGGAVEIRAQLLKDLDSDFLIFFPTRHDWVDGDCPVTFGSKANDRLLRAFITLRKRGLRLGLICCAWGHNVEESKTLLDEAGVTPYVSWTNPLGMMRFIRFAQACDLVADQFVLGAFGGVFFKAMAAGAPVLTYLRESEIRSLYQVPPPALNCETTEEIIAGLENAYGDPEYLKQLRIASRKWIVDFHNAEDVVAKQLLQFGPFLKKIAPPALSGRG